MLFVFNIFFHIRVLKDNTVLVAIPYINLDILLAVSRDTKRPKNEVQSMMLYVQCAL